jgi:2-dehydro-3-deoxygluconokinase
MSLDVITVGEPMVLFAAADPGPLAAVNRYARMTAGAELNFAIGIARLGLSVGYLTRLGEDSFGRYLAEAVAHEGVQLGVPGFDATRGTGFMLKSRSDNGSDPQIEYHRKGSAASAMTLADIPKGTVEAVRHLHLTGIYVAVSAHTRELVFALAQQARAAGRTVSFDPNLRPRLWSSQAEMVTTLNQLATHADYVLPGLEEGRLLTGCDSAEGVTDFYLQQGARCVIVKLGAEGAYYANQAGERGYAPGVPVARVVDTVGAGDGFAAGVVSGLLEGLPLHVATSRGNAIGARVVQFPGDCDGLPTRAELLAFQQGNQ